MIKQEMDLRGRVAVVTGGSRGIGRATVLEFARCGSDVVISYVSDAAAARRTAQEVEQEFGVKAVTCKSDVCRVADAEILVQSTIEAFGRIDVLVCNAGIWEGGAVEEIEEQMWDRVIDVNLKGTWTVCRAAIPEMKRQGFGRIVIVSSTAGQRGEAFVSNYAASKGGQIAFTKSLAIELAAHNINVNCVAPGWVETDMNDGVFADNGYRQRVTETIPLGRIPPPEDIARPIVFLASSWARHITGEVLNINGGSVLCG